MNDETLPVVVCFIENLYFSARTESTIRRSGYECILIENADQIAPIDKSPAAHRLTEPLEGARAALVEKITLWQPSLIVFDLDNSGVPWSDWILTLKSSAATRRIPIICFGSHKDKPVLKTAIRAGANGVFSRNRFFNDLPTLIRDYAPTHNKEQLKSACLQPLSDLAVKGLEEFNNRNYFEAHEYLEDAWNEDHSMGRELYRAILQLAVAYLQIERGNYRGAKKMFLRVRQWIDPLPPKCRGVNVAELRNSAYLVQDELSKLDANNLSGMDQDLLRPIQFSISDNK